MDNITAEVVELVAKQMLVAARTAPKAMGVDNLRLALVSGEGIKKLSDEMKKLAASNGMAYFNRDAASILKASCIVLLGTGIKPLGLKTCGFCGYKSCAEKLKNSAAPCIFNTGDLGIAIGAAVSLAADNRIDNRIMFSAGVAALSLGLLGDAKVAYGVPLSASAKNPFFDRQ